MVEFLEKIFNSIPVLDKLSCPKAIHPDFCNIDFLLTPKTVKEEIDNARLRVSSA